MTSDELTPREQAARRLLALDALRKLLEESRTRLRTVDGALFKPGSSDSAELHGVDLGTVSRPKTKEEYEVIDFDEFLAWVEQEHPEHVVTETVTVTSVSPGFTAELLRAIKAGNAGEFVDRATGEVSDAPPGVRLVRKPGSLTVRPSKSAPAVVAAALGPVAEVLGLPALES